MQHAYSEQFKKTAVQKYLNRGNRSVAAVAQEMGTTPFSIYQWVKSYQKGDPIMNKSPRSPEDLSPSEKLSAILEYSGISEVNKGEWLRKNGLTEEKIDAWREMAKAGLGKKPDTRESAEDKREIKKLEKELRRKDKALAETAALLVLQKKIAEIYGSEDE
jgi:transposase